VSTNDRDANNFCYRHPDRQSYILCQRCGRTICPECQTQAAVGVHCPECTREARQNAPRTKPRIITAVRSGSGQPVVTYGIIGLTAIVFLLQLVTSDFVTIWLYYEPIRTAAEPWTMITALFVHAGFLHILLNMYSLYVIGPMIEMLLGRVRYLALYLISGFGGSVAVLLLAPNHGVLGASGAIFGLLGALFVIQRKLGGNTTQLFVVIAINLAIGFVIPQVSWQAHVGGLVTGALVALAFLATRNIRQRNQQILLVSGIVLALVVTTIVGYTQIQ
jgi:membrane associated rhomboid family serine protease